MVKMIVTDLDGTLLRGDKSVSDYTAEILNGCKKMGMKVVFATARPERATRRIQEKIIPDYVIANNGATINQGDFVIRNLLIPSTMIDELLDLFLSSQEVKLITVEADNCMFTNYKGPDWETGWNTIYTDFSDGFKFDAPKLSVECENADFLSGVMHNYPDLHLYSNSGENWHQIMSKDATKTNAIYCLTKSLGLTLHEVVAFGDDYNDIEMLRQCGIGVAVANAIDEAKAAADYICNTNENDGVGNWLKEQSNNLTSIEESLEHNKQEIVCVASEGNRLVGLCCGQIFKSMCYSVPYGEITELYVSEKYRRLNVASGLMAFIETAFHKHGINYYQLFTGKSNIAAQAFYQSLGYVDTPEMMFRKQPKDGV